MNQQAFGPEGAPGLHQTDRQTVFAGEIDPQELSADLAGHFRPRRIEIEDDDADALCRQRPGDGLARSRGASGDDGGDAVIEFHSSPEAANAQNSEVKVIPNTRGMV